ncbi:hypothetical protein LCGC14_1811940 [marine sediment metagenome]|uniref:Uncharacterized protein n=1 Tax=marine sediment metagenome TaxID=412755 RepID=A0A0F9JL51_9ZZZZ
MYLRYVHGAFNLTVALFVFYQFRLGRGMRLKRLAGETDPQMVKKHMRLGPYAVAGGILGFTAGTTLIILDKGRVLAYPVHFVFGGLIALGLVYTFMLSRKMVAGDPSKRTLHGRVGMALVALYAVQVLLGLGILL